MTTDASGVRSLLDGELWPQLAGPDSCNLQLSPRAMKAGRGLTAAERISVILTFSRSKAGVRHLRKLGTLI